MSSLNSTSTAKTQEQEVQHFDASGKPLPSNALKWGVSPRGKDDKRNEVIDPTTGKAMDWENYYDEATKEKLRKKGVNPALKAEMEYATTHSEGKGLWQRIAGTSWGGGWIK